MNKKWGRGQGFYQKYSFFYGRVKFGRANFLSYFSQDVQRMCLSVLSVYLVAGRSISTISEIRNHFLMYILSKISVFIIYYIRHYRQSLKFQINFYNHPIIFEIFCWIVFGTSFFIVVLEHWQLQSVPYSIFHILVETLHKEQNQQEIQARSHLLYKIIHVNCSSNEWKCECPNRRYARLFMSSI